MAAASSADAAPEGDKSAMFAELSKIDQSSGRTAGLRHVTKDMKAKTDDAPAPAASSAKPKPAGKAAEKPKYPASKTKKGLRWVVENFSKDDGVITVEGVALKEEVYIAGCINATIIIPDKCKAIAIDGCKKTQILFEGAVSSCEVINCKNIKMQCKSFVPTIGIDKVDGIMVYVSYAGRATHFITSKSSEMNVCFPETDSDESEMKELPIPEQFVAKITASNELDVNVSDLYSS
jgi:adenylyl cyclase-associated protein